MKSFRKFFKESMIRSALVERIIFLKKLNSNWDLNRAYGLNFKAICFLVPAKTWRKLGVNIAPIFETGMKDPVFRNLIVLNESEVKRNEIVFRKLAKVR